MNGLEEIQEYIKKFACEKQQIQQQIVEIEGKRTQLAGQRNEIKKFNSDYEAINELGRQICELGNQSQELQNKLNFEHHALKTQMNLIIHNLIAEAIRKVRIINQQIQELEEKSENQKERNAKYQLQRQEFYVRFGRMPELSERAEKESELQGKETTKSVLEIELLKEQVVKIEDEIIVLSRIKRELKNGNWNSIIEVEDEANEVHIEELNIEEMAPIEEISVEEFEKVEELYIEEFEPIEEIQIEEFKEIEELETETFDPIKESSIDEIEELARAIVEEIVTEQTMDYSTRKIEENVEDVITNKQESEKKEKVIIPLFGQRATISNITIKIEEGQLVYRAQMSDGEEIKLYPSKLGDESVLLRDKQNRAECTEILTNYVSTHYKVFDKKVIKKIDPLVCELLIECAEIYNYEAQDLIYNYAMSFSYNEETEKMPAIIYDLSDIEQSNLNEKEKAIINKICRNASKNKTDSIELVSIFKKIKHVVKRLFSINSVKVLPEGKY